MLSYRGCKSLMWKGNARLFLFRATIAPLGRERKIRAFLATAFVLLCASNCLNGICTPNLHLFRSCWAASQISAKFPATLVSQTALVVYSFGARSNCDQNMMMKTTNQVFNTGIRAFNIYRHLSYVGVTDHRSLVTEQGGKGISLSDIRSSATPVSPSTSRDCKLRAEGGALHLNRSSNRQLLYSDTGAGL